MAAKGAGVATDDEPEGEPDDAPEGEAAGAAEDTLFEVASFEMPLPFGEATALVVSLLGIEPSLRASGSLSGVFSGEGVGEEPPLVRGIEYSLGGAATLKRPRSPATVRNASRLSKVCPIRGRRIHKAARRKARR